MLLSPPKGCSPFQRLLFAARIGTKSMYKPKSRPLRQFPLYSKHVRREAISFSPSDFHRELCDKIRSAKSRVYLASLYIGPAADPNKSPRELALLEALENTKCSNVQILLDHNRALRPVRLSSDCQTSSAEACHRALLRRSASSQSNIHLISVLPEWLQRSLPNPLNEIAGVFHLKVYIIDDELILSGANLSEEYFTDRVDRYLWLHQGANGLVECYSDLLHLLFRYATPYETPHKRGETMSKKDFIRSLEKILTTSVVESSSNGFDHTDEDVVAFAVPTLQLPPHFLSDSPYDDASLPLDEDVLENMLQELSAGQHPPQHKQSGIIRMASAYLNPTYKLQNIMNTSFFSRVHLLTAGKTSHGFKAKTSGEENHGAKVWIPGIFDQYARQTANRLKSCGRLWFYQRKGWTFHAKGLWLSSIPKPEKDDEDAFPLCFDKKDSTSLVAVTHGSSNYGARSALRDMESNVILIFPTRSTASLLQKAFCDEWNHLCSFASGEQERDDLPRFLRFLLPVIRSFF